MEYSGLETSKLQGNVKRLELQLKTEFPELNNLILTLRQSGDIYVSSIRVKPKHRGKGIGSKVIKKILDFADKNNKYVTLVAVAQPGYEKKLTKLYKTLGFIPNKRKRMMPQFSHKYHTMMIRKPKS